MSFLARLLSPDYRRALAAEAEGDLARAVGLYARTGRLSEVVRLRRRLAGQAADATERVAQLRFALESAERILPSCPTRELRAELARALVAEASEGALVEAARIFAKLGDHLAEAEALVSAGRVGKAREALVAGRHFERLEALDRAEASRQARDAAVDAALAGAREALARGARHAAVRALSALCGDDDDPRLEPARALLARIEAARPEGRLALLAAGHGGAVTVVADLPAILGRSETSPLPLSDPGVSRHHVRVVRANGAFALDDLGSRNGTLVDGLPVGDGFVLGEAGRLDLGERCRIAWQGAGDGVLLLEVERGLAAGTRAALLAGPVDLARVLPGAPRARLVFEGGFFVLESEEALALGGERVPAPARVELLVGDRIELSGVDLEVRRR